MILMIDNYDSFTFNLVQALEAAGAEVRVVRNDAMTRADVEALADDPAAGLHGIVISPDPATRARPACRSRSIEVAAERRIPLLGVCLGMQSMAAAYGAAIVRAPTLVHGEASAVEHDGEGLLAGMPEDFPAARYHSLCVDPATLPAELYVTATSPEDGVIMGLRHRTLPLEGVQFHPESVLTPRRAAPAGELPAPGRVRATGRGWTPCRGRSRRAAWPPRSRSRRATPSRPADERPGARGADGDRRRPDAHDRRGAPGDGRGHGRRGDAVAAGRAADGPADARRDRRRARRLRDARCANAWCGSRRPRERSTWSAPAATARARSTSRRRRRWLSPPAASRSPSTATGR